MLYFILLLCQCGLVSKVDHEICEPFHLYIFWRNSSLWLSHHLYSHFTHCLFGLFSISRSCDMQRKKQCDRCVLKDFFSYRKENFKKMLPIDATTFETFCIFWRDSFFFLVSDMTVMFRRKHCLRRYFNIDYVSCSFLFIRNFFCRQKSKYDVFTSFIWVIRILHKQKLKLFY